MVAEAVLELDLVEVFSEKTAADTSQSYEPQRVDQNLTGGPFKSRSRKEVMEKIANGEEDMAVREQVLDPRVDRAANELVALDDKGIPTKIELEGKPYDVLQDLAEKLEAIGTTHHSVTQLVGALEDFCIHEGINFTKEAKAKPLLVRLEVTDKKPDDIPDCGKHQFTFLDGQRRLGQQATQMAMGFTIHGTTSTKSSPMGMEEMFEQGKKKGLLIFFAATDGNDLHKFDNIDASLADLLQAFMDDEVTLKELEKMILDGELPAEAMQLIEAIAEYKNILAEMQTPGAVEDAENRLEELAETITELIELGMEAGFLPEGIMEAISAQFEELQNEVSAEAEQSLEENLDEDAPEVEAEVEAEDLDLAAEDTDPEVLDAVEEIAEQIELLLEADDLDPDVRSTLEEALESLAGVEGSDLEALSQSLSQVMETLTELAMQGGLSDFLFHQTIEVLKEIRDFSNDVLEPLGLDILPEAEATVENTVDAEVEAEIEAETELDADAEETLENAEPDADTPEIENLEQAEELLEVLENIAEQLEAGDINMDSLPPEIKDMLETIGELSALVDAEGRMAAVEKIAEAMNGQGDLAFAESLQVVTEVLSNPEITKTLMDALPEAAQETLTQILSEQNVIESVQNTLNTQIENRQQIADLLQDIQNLEGIDDPALQDKLIELTERLETEGITPDVIAELKTVSEALPSEIVATLPTPIETVIEAVTSQPVAAEPLSPAESINLLQDALEVIDPASPEAEAIQNVIDKIEAGEPLTTDDVTALKAVEATDPAVQASVAEVVQAAELNVATNEIAQSLNDLQNVEGVDQAAIAEIVQKIETQGLTQEVADQLQVLQVDLPPEVAAAVAPQIEAAIEIFSEVLAPQVSAEPLSPAETANVLQDALETVTPASPEAEAIQNVIDKIEAGEPLTTDDVTALKAVEATDPAVQASVAEVVQAAELNVAANEITQSLTDLQNVEGVDQAAIAEIVQKIETQGLTQEVADQLQVLQVDLPPEVAAAVAPQIETAIEMSAVVQAPPADMTQPVTPVEALNALQDAVEAVAPNTPEAEALQNVIERLDAGEVISAEDLATLKSIETHAPEVAEAISQVQNVVDRVSEAPASMAEAVEVTLQKVAETIEPGTQDALDVQAVTEKLETGEALTSADVEVLKAIEVTDPATQQQLSEIVKTAEVSVATQDIVESLKQTQQTLEGADKAVITEIVERIETQGLTQDTAKELQSLQTSLPPEIRDTISDAQNTALDRKPLDVTDAHITPHQDTGTNVIEAAAAFDQVPDKAQLALKEGESLTAAQHNQNNVVDLPQAKPQESAQELKTPGVAKNLFERAAQPAKDIRPEAPIVNKDIQALINEKQHEPAKVDPKVDQEASKEEIINRSACDTCTSKDCDNCSKGGVKIIMADRLNELKVKQAENALREKENAYQPQKIEQKPDNPKEAANIAGCAGCTTRDCANCSKGGAKVAMLEKLQSLREKQEAALPQTQNQNQYKPPETQAKPQQTKQERINVTGCEACTSKDCANCSKGGAKALMHEKLQALKDKQGEYKPPETQAKPQQTKQERINVTGCDGCTTRDCASCSKGGGKAALAARLNELKEQQQQKTYTPREQKSESYKAPEVIQKPDTVNERANLDACAGCTSRDCANCSKGGAKAAMTAKLSALKSKQQGLEAKTAETDEAYKTSKIYAHAENKMDEAEIVHASGCEGCTTRDCANCSKGGAKALLADELKKLRGRQSQAQPELANRAA